MIKLGRFSLLVSIAWVALMTGMALCAEEASRTPSEQMKEAVGKISKAPATIGKSLQDLTDAAKAKLKQAFGGPSKPNEDKQLNLDVPQKSLAAPLPTPNAMKETGRDPFRPMTLRAKVPRRAKENLSPLERFDLSQLKLVGIIWDIKEPRAMVEDSAGLGYVVKVGTPIGNNEGKIKAIHHNEVVVEEIYSDAYGKPTKRDVTMKILSE
ncbi:MAG: pilus assembly protein PilP [Chloroflexota bacterium]